MPEVHTEIDQKQQEILALKGPESANAEISRYRNTFVNAVDEGQNFIKSAQKKKWKTDAVNSYLDSAGAEITGHLTNIAARGREIIKAHEEKKEAPLSLEDLSAALKASLEKQKNAIESFRVLDEIDTEQKQIKDANDKLNNSPGTEPPTKIYAEKQKLVDQLSRIEPKFLSNEASKEYADSLRTEHTGLSNAIKTECTALSTGPSARFILLQNFVSEVAGFASLVEATKKDPSIQNIQEVKARMAKINPEQASTNIFGEADAAPYPYIANLYRQMETGDFKNAKDSLEKVKTEFSGPDGIESKALSKAGEKMAADIEATEKPLLAMWDNYDALAKRGDLSKEEMDKFTADENSLMSGYLLLQSAASPFAAQETRFKISNSDVYKKVLDTVTRIDGRVRQIEVYRQTRLSTKSLAEVSVGNILTYVTFSGEDKNGKIYEFNAAFSALSKEKQMEVRMVVESLIARDDEIVRGQTRDAKIELNKTSGNFEKIKEVLGEKSAKYVEGLKLLAAGNHQGALAAFKEYVAQPFSDDEKQTQAMALKDANEKVSLITLSADFYEGLNRYKDNNLDAAARLFKSYIENLSGRSGEVVSLHAEQVSQAKDLFMLIGGKKADQLNDLFQDLKEWEKAKIKEAYGTGGEKLDIKMMGPEVDLIAQGIQDLRDKVNKGELVDFDAEFAKLKASVNIFMQKNAINPEDSIIDKMDKLYPGMNSDDPAVRKKTYIEFAKELVELRGGAYDMARKYLDKALDEDYKKEAQSVNQETIIKRMMGDPAIMADIHQGANFYLNMFIRENPTTPVDQLRARSEQIVFNMQLKKQVNRELRHNMTNAGAAGANEALQLFNSWTPYDPHVWYKPSTWTIETYDEYKDAAKQFIAETAVMTAASLATGGAAAATEAGALRSLVGVLLRGGAKTAARESALMAIERGGITALKVGSEAFEALEPALQQVILKNRIVLNIARGAAYGVGVGAEGAMMYGTGQLTQGLVYGQGEDFSSGALVESILKAVVYRGIGMGGNRLFGRLMKQGGVRGAAAYVGMESFSGLLGTGVEAANLYRIGQGKEVNTQWILQNLLQNALQSGGSHYEHAAYEAVAKPAEGRGAKKIRKAYYKDTVDSAAKRFGVDFNRSDTIRHARIDSADGNLIINGKKVRGFDTGMLQHLPPAARERILALTPNTAIETHYRSRFTTEVPAELLHDPDNPDRPKNPASVQGWVDTSGIVHFNLEHLNNGFVEGATGQGPYREAPPGKIMPEGFSAKVADKPVEITLPDNSKVTVPAGDLYIVGPDGPVSFHQFVKSPQGKNLLPEMVRIKNHETGHQIIEFGFTREETGEGGVKRRVEDHAKTKAVIDLFARPGEGGTVPENKIAMTDVNGNPVEPTWKNIQEFLCRIADGSQKNLSSKQIEALENAIRGEGNKGPIPGFRFKDVRKLSTKAIAQNPARAFARAEAAARDTAQIPVEMTQQMPQIPSQSQTSLGEQPTQRVDVTEENTQKVVAGSKTRDVVQLAAQKSPLAESVGMPSHEAVTNAEVKTAEMVRLPDELIDKITLTDEKFTLEEQKLIEKAVAREILPQSTAKEMIKQGRLEPSEKIIHVLIEKDAVSALMFCSDNSITVSSVNQALAAEVILMNQAKMDKEAAYQHVSPDRMLFTELRTLIERGRINAADPLVLATLTSYTDGVRLVKDYLKRGEIRLTQELLTKFLHEIDHGLGFIETNYTYKNNPSLTADRLDGSLSIESIRAQVQGRKRCIFDSRMMAEEFSRLGNSFNDSLKMGLERIAAGNPDRSKKLDVVLTNLKYRDEEGYGILRDNFDKIDGNILMAIVQGSKIEFHDENGQRILAYQGNHIGEGGMGSVAHVAFAVDGRTDLQFGVIKTPHEAERDMFRVEGQNARLPQQWNHPNINKALHISDKFIIYETGKDAKNLFEAANHLTPQQMGEVLKQITLGLIHYDMEGYMHCDIKELNVIVYFEDTPAGPKIKAQIIDNNPVRASDFEHGQASSFAATTGYFSQQTQIDVITGDAHSASIDQYALGVIIENQYADRTDFSPEMRQYFKDLAAYLKQPQPRNETNRLDTVLSGLEVAFP
jgi:hypothetical protein